MLFRSAVVELAFRLSDEGSMGLAALLRCLRRPEFALSLRRGQGANEPLDRLIELLEWMLRFPAVWALSEGNNLLDLRSAFGSGGTVWIEMYGSYFERLEHQLAAWMVDAALMDTFISQQSEAPGATRSQSGAPPIVLYAFPKESPLPMCHGNVDIAKQIGLFQFSGIHPLPDAAKPWLDAGADCWITGELGAIAANSTSSWLSDAERQRLQKLASGEVWARAGATQKAVTMLVRPPETEVAISQTLRRMALKRLRLSPVKQFSSAYSQEDAPAPQNLDLYAKLCRKEALYTGWFRVKSHNKHSQGHDGVTIAMFGSKLDAELERLSNELTQGRYRARPLRTARLPKPDGDTRLIRIASVRDRVVQAACLQLIEPLFDARFSAMSFAYRPGRGAHQAVALVRSAIRAGKHFAVTADIRKCFDSIDHDILLRQVGDVIGDRDLIQLIRMWLTTDVIDFMDVIPSELGVPQGEAISPLLANIYLDPLDKQFEQSGITFVRYADDYVVLCDTEVSALAALQMMTEFLHDALRLALKPAKTNHGHVEAGIAFLGFSIGLDDACIPQEKVDRTLDVISTQVEAFAAADASPQSQWLALDKFNALVRGFRNYFSIDNAEGVRTQLAAMDTSIDAIAHGRFVVGDALSTMWSARERLFPLSDVIEGGNVAEAASATGTYMHEVSGASDAHSYLRRDHQPVVATALKPLDAVAARADQDSDADVLAIDGRLHVMRSGCFVTIRGDDVVVRRNKKDVFCLPIADLNLAYMEGKGIAISADLTMRLCENDIPVIFTPLVGAPSAIAQSIQSSRSNVRQQQVLRRNDPDILKSGFNMLAAKVANQASVLKYFSRYRKRKGDANFDDLNRSADEIRLISETLDNIDPVGLNARNSGMGHEGRAAAKYWAAFARFIPAQLAFPGRHTRHATDAVNSAINYVYGILYGEVWRAVVRAGLDPYFGIIHGTDRDQGSLIFDMIEEYRAPFADRVVLGMLGRGFAIEFDKDGRIRPACRHKIVNAFHKLWHRELRWRGKLYTPGSILEIQVASLKNSYLGKGDYRAFRFRW